MPESRTGLTLGSPQHQAGPLYFLATKKERGSFNKATPQIPVRSFPWLPAAWVQAPPVCVCGEIGVKLMANPWGNTTLEQLSLSEQAHGSISIHYSSAQLGSQPTSSSLPLIHSLFWHFSIFLSQPQKCSNPVQNHKHSLQAGLIVASLTCTAY